MCAMAANPINSNFSARRPLLSVDGVRINLSPPQPALGDGCTVHLHKTQVYRHCCTSCYAMHYKSLQMDLVSGTAKVCLPFSAIKSIDVSVLTVVHN